MIFGKADSGQVSLANPGEQGLVVTGTTELGVVGDANGDGRTDLLATGLPYGFDTDNGAPVAARGRHLGDRPRANRSVGTGSARHGDLRTPAHYSYREPVGHALGGSLLAAGDVNGDGRADLYATESFPPASSGLRLLYRRPAAGRIVVGSADPARESAPIGYAPESAGDLDRNGHLDAVSSYNPYLLGEPNGLRVALGPLVGTAGDPRVGSVFTVLDPAAPASYLTGAGGGDLDGDGHDDLVVGEEAPPGGVGHAYVVGLPAPVPIGRCAAHTVGTNGEDYLRGVSSGTTILGLGGADVLTGQAGADCLYGGAGSDQLNGGGGHDLLDAGTGTGGELSGGPGDDRLLGESGGGGDLNGGPGRDLLVVRGAQGGTALGGTGDDVLLGSRGQDDLDGQAGNDRLRGGASGDSLVGGSGNDFLDGGEGPDELQGEPGRDRLRGGGDADELLGGAGADHLDGGAFNDVLDGGAGNDVLGGGQGDDALAGGSGDDLLLGGSGHDVLIGGPGRDRLLAGAGNDLIRARDGRRDVVDCGAGTGPGRGRPRRPGPRLRARGPAAAVTTPQRSRHVP